jgi:hypothetical protein
MVEPHSNACAGSRRRPATCAITTCSSVSADGRSFVRPTGRASASTSRKLAASRSPFGTPLDEMISRSGFRERTTLKLPLVPMTQPRE